MSLVLQITAVLLISVTGAGVATAQFLSNTTAFAGIDTTAGNGDGGPAYYSTLTFPTSITGDAKGNTYLAEASRIRKIDAAGVITTIAGGGQANPFDSSGPALSADVFDTRDVKVDSKGNVYFSQKRVNIRRLTPDGILSTYAGHIGGIYNGEGVAALSAGITPEGIAIDALDQVYFADASSVRVRVIRADGNVYTVAGTGVSGTAGENGPALQAQLINPSALAFDAAGNLYIADSQRVVKVDRNGILTRIAGNLGNTDPDEVAALSTQVNATAIAVDAAGSIIVGTPRIRRITPDGVIHAVTLHWDFITPFTEACGDALHSSVYAGALWTDAAGNIEVANPIFGRVEQITRTGRISTIAGDGPNRFTGDGGPVANATFAGPTGIAFDKNGNLYVADTLNNRIRRIDKNGIITTVVGDGGPTYDQDPACTADSDAFLRQPAAITFDTNGELFIADTGKDRVLRIAPEGTRSIAVKAPVGVAVDAAGNVYAASRTYGQVFEFGPNGTARALASRGASGQMAFDGFGNLFIPAGYEVDRFGVTGSLGPVAGTGEYRTSIAPGFTGLQAEIGYPSAVAFDAGGSLYIADSLKGAIQRISAQCYVLFDKAGPQPSGLAFDAGGALYISDAHQGVIWKSTPLFPPVRVGPTPMFSADAVQSAVPVPFIQPLGQPPLPAYSPPIAPGELVVLRGECMGPFEPVTTRLDANGQLPSSAGGVQITANGTPVPLLSVSSGEILAVAPFELDSSSGAQWSLTYGGITANAGSSVNPAAPAVFMLDGAGSGFAAAVNQDGSINSQANPAAKGSIMALFMTGLGQTEPVGIDGQSGRPPFASLKQPVQVTIGGQTALVLYAGLAPGFTGLYQVNIQLPVGIKGGAATVTVSSGIYAGRQTGVYVWVGQ